MESSTAIMNNKFIAVVLLIVLAGLAVTACGGDPGEGETSQEGADKTGESIASKIQELSVDLDKTDGTCKATPGDLISPVGAPGVFAILCDGIKVGTFTATE